MIKRPAALISVFYERGGRWSPRDIAPENMTLIWPGQRNPVADADKMEIFPFLLSAPGPVLEGRVSLAG